MEIDGPDASNGSIHGNQETNGLRLYPVAIQSGGDGLPYAPEDWPNPGDKWSWKVGIRVVSGGYFKDRYIYPPKHIQERGPRGGGFASKQSAEQYIRKKFPNADVNAFFASFSWRIPAKGHTRAKDSVENARPLEETAEPAISDSEIGGPACKAGNRTCSSLEDGNSPSRFMACDICCSEPGFCRDCCCILCCKTINSVHGGYSFVRCEALVGGYICAHVAHIKCGLRAYLAGTVGGSIGLDAEYYCRRCDSRSDLVSHVQKLLKTAKTVGSRAEIEEMLEVGVCILRGSLRESAKQLSHYISLAMDKLNSGADLEDIWKDEDELTTKEGEQSPGENGNVVPTDHKDRPKRKASSPPPTLSSEFDDQFESLSLDDETKQILLELKKSLEFEYRITEEALTAQTAFIRDLYKQLQYERSELSKNTSSSNAYALHDKVKSRMDQIKQEIKKFEGMKGVAKGFVRAPKRILKAHFVEENEEN